MNVTKEQILDALRKVEDPDLHRDIVTLGFIKDLSMCGGTAKFTIELTTPACPVKDMLKKQAHEVVMAIPGMEAVNIQMTSNVRSRTGPSPSALSKGLKNILAVSSGKGGVGKSTVATNLAVALSETGASVGLLDCDLYGPDIPRMLGIERKPDVRDGKLQPIERHGVKSMSIGYLVEPDQPVVWRGPMLHKAIEQFIGDVVWEELDYLLVDMPPGTGDVQLSLAQLVPLAGAVVVTTPQQVAVDDVRKAIGMFRQVHVDVLGVVENMAGFVCPHCEKTTEVFGRGGAQALSEKFKIPVLGRIPLDLAVRAGGDSGEPILKSHPDSPTSKAFREVAGQLAAQLSIRASMSLPVLQ